MESPVNSSLRGLHAIDNLVVWASGSEGTFLRTVDGGESWNYGSVVDTADFRDIYAFSEKQAIMISAGAPALIFKTNDGGNSWQLKYNNADNRIFFDAIDFWDDQHGIAFSDAIDGKFYIIITEDGGETWSFLETSPEATAGEGGFAASGTNMITAGEGGIWIGTTTGRILHSENQGLSWTWHGSPLADTLSSAGIFSLAFDDAGHGIMVGGDFINAGKIEKNAAYLNGGNQWILVTDHPPGGYRSCVALIPASSLAITTGPGGTDVSYDFGKTWYPLDTTGYHAVSFGKSKTSGWLSGLQGRIAKIVVTK